MKNTSGIESKINGNIMNGFSRRVFDIQHVCIIGGYYPKTSKSIIRVYLNLKITNASFNLLSLAIVS
jgi:hypothetical protein